MMFTKKLTKIVVTVLGIFLIISGCSLPQSDNTNSQPPAEDTTYQPGALIDAVNNQDLVLVERILRQPNYPIDEVNAKQETPLLIATHLNYVEIAKRLIDAGADVNKQDAIQDSAYLFGAAEGRTEILRYILEHAQPNQQVYNRYGGNSIIPAAEKGHIENVRLLLTDGKVDINHQNNFGYTALIEAVALTDGSKVYQDIVRLLVDAGADQSLRDNSGKTALDYARQKNYQEIINILA